MTSRPNRIPRGDAERTLTVEGGQVVCPYRGVTDLERCWTCPAYQGLSTGRIEGVVCAAEPPMPTVIDGRWRDVP